MHFHSFTIIHGILNSFSSVVYNMSVACVSKHTANALQHATGPKGYGTDMTVNIFPSDYGVVYLLGTTSMMEPSGRKCSSSMHTSRWVPGAVLR